MKKLIIILGLFGLVLNTFAQSELERDVIKAEEQLFIRGDSLTKFINDNSPATSQLGFNFDYTFNSATSDSKPGTGLFKLNNASYASVTQIYIDDLDNNSVDKSKFLAVPDTGSYISLITDNGNYVIYQLTGAITDAVGYYKYGVTYDNNNGVISGATTIDIQISNNVGGGGGGLTSPIDTLTVTDTLFIGENKAYNMSDVGSGLYITDTTYSPYLWVSNVFAGLGIATTWVNAYVDNIEIKNGVNEMQYTGDTLFANGSGGSTKNHIKVGTLTADSLRFSDGPGYLSGINNTGKIQEDTIQANNALIVGTDTATSFSFIDGYTYDSLLFNSVVEESAHQEGNLHYEDATKSLTFHNDIEGFNHNLGYEHVVRFYNNTGSTLTEGTIIRSSGAHVNASINFLGDLAGISSLDSLQGVAMVTADVDDGMHGIATVIGQVNGLNTSAYSNNQILWLSHAGTFQTTSPDPPLFSKIIGRVVYADADSGAIYFYGFGETSYSPEPTFSALFEDQSAAITNPGLDAYALITNGTNDLFTEDINFGFTLTGDSIQVNQPGLYNVAFAYSFQGDASQNDNWRIGVFVNGVKEFSISRTSSTTNRGGVPFSKDLDLDVDDWVTVRVANTDVGTRNCTFIDGILNISFLTSE